MKLTEDFLKSGGKNVKHTLQQRAKARIIYTLEEAYTGKIAFIERMLGGPKTTNFFHNIYQPANPNFVTIDRHMIWAMLGDYNLTDITTKQYNFLKDCLIEYARNINMIPSELQCVIWLTTKLIKKDIKIW